MGEHTLKDSGKTRFGAGCLQVAVKYHGYGAHEIPAHGRDAESVVVQAEQTLCLQGFQVGHFGRKIC